jgi:hypothetical protein
MNARDRCDVADEIEIQLVVKCHVDRVRHTEFRIAAIGLSVE